MCVLLCVYLHALFSVFKRVCAVSCTIIHSLFYDIDSVCESKERKNEWDHEQ